MASDTSLVFNILAKDNVSRALNAVRNAFTSTGRQAEEAMNKASVDTARLDAEIDKVDRDLAELNRRFAETGDKTLFAKISRDRSLLNQLRSVRRGLDDTSRSSRDVDRDGHAASTAMRLMGNVASSTSGFLSSMGTSTSGLVSSVGGLVAAVAALSAGLSLAGPLLHLVGGAIGSLPGIIAGGAAAVGTLKLGFSGISDEYTRLSEAADKASGAVDANGKKITRLADSARDFLKVLLDLRPAFENLRLGVQERLFAGLSDKLRTMSRQWIPQLNTSLGAMASTFNGILKDLFDSFSKPDFISNIGDAIESTNKAIGRMGEAISGPLVDAFGRLASSAGPFIERVGDEIAGVVEKFSGWIKQLDETGALDNFFEEAADVFSDVVDILEDLGSIAGSVMSIIFGTEEDSDMSTWDSLVVAIDKVAKWFKDPDNQKRIKDFMLSLEEGIMAVGRIVDKIDGWATTIDGWATSFDNAKNNITGFFDDVSGKISGFFDAAEKTVKGFPGKVSGAIASLPGRLLSVVTGAFSRMQSFVFNAIGAAVRTVAGLPGRIGRALAPLSGTVSRAVSGAIRWFQTMPSRAWAAVRNVGRTVASALSDLGGRLWGAGQNAVIGLWNGISSMGGWLWSRVYNFAGNVVNGMLARLGIGSPSKVMAEAVGEWIPPGIAAGMDATSDTVLDAAQRISDRLANTTMAAPSIEPMNATGSGTGQGMAAAPARPQTVQIELLGEREIVALMRRLIRTANLLQTT